MATTVIFVEIMIMGIITFAWLFIILWRIGLIPLGELASVLPILKEWNASILILAAALAYQLGSLMNTASFGVMELLRGNKIKKAIMSPHDYEMALAVVNQKASPEVVKRIQGHTTYIRLARSAIFNFFFLGITLLFIEGFRGIGILFLLLALVGYPVWCTIYKLRYQELRAAYEIISEIVGVSLPNSQEKK